MGSRENRFFLLQDEDSGGSKKRKRKTIKNNYIDFYQNNFPQLSTPNNTQTNNQETRFINLRTINNTKKITEYNTFIIEQRPKAISQNFTVKNVNRDGSHLISILLIRAGIELNSGPEVWWCSVCGARLRRNVTTVQCNGCHQWCHLRRCSGLRKVGDYTESFIGNCCVNTTTTNGNNNANNPNNNNNIYSPPRSDTMTNTDPITTTVTDPHPDTNSNQAANRPNSPTF